MDKKLILAVAGSGKTSYIINRLSLEKRFLIITYTQNNCQNIKNKIVRKFSFLPENIHVFTYFTFLYSFCFKPFLYKELGVTGINYKPCGNKFAKDLDRYIDKSRRIYSNRIVKLLDFKNSMDSVVSRLSKYFDEVLIDEIQDFSGHDFNFLFHIISSNNSVIFVGDFHQHTFDTSRDGNVNVNLHNDLKRYTNRFEEMGMRIDSDTLLKSYRCSKSVCAFVSDQIGLRIESHRSDDTDIREVDCPKTAMELFENDGIIKLFYQNSRKYACYSRNWGECKGEDYYEDVCVVLNKTTYEHFSENRLSELNPQTRNKLYVAITRTRRDLIFVNEKLFKCRMLI